MKYFSDKYRLLLEDNKTYTKIDADPVSRYDPTSSFKTAFTLPLYVGRRDGLQTKFRAQDERKEIIKHGTDALPDVERKRNGGLTETERNDYNKLIDDRNELLKKIDDINKNPDLVKEQKQKEINSIRSNITTIEKKLNGYQQQMATYRKTNQSSDSGSKKRKDSSQKSDSVSKSSDGGSQKSDNSSQKSDGGSQKRKSGAKAFTATDAEEWQQQYDANLNRQYDAADSIVANKTSSLFTDLEKSAVEAEKKGDTEQAIRLRNTAKHLGDTLNQSQLNRNATTFSTMKSAWNQLNPQAKFITGAGIGVGAASSMIFNNNYYNALQQFLEANPTNPIVQLVLKYPQYSAMFLTLLIAAKFKPMAKKFVNYMRTKGFMGSNKPIVDNNKRK